MPETIVAYFRQGLGSAMHSWIVYTNAQGQQFALSGFPSVGGLSGLLFGHGTLEGYAGPYRGSTDYPYSESYLASQILVEAPSLSGKWDLIVECRNRMDILNPVYDKIVLNSNSLVTTCLSFAGLPPITIDTPFPLPGGLVWTPGSQTDLSSLLTTPSGGGPPLSQQFYQQFFGRGALLSYETMQMITMPGILRTAGEDGKFGMVKWPDDPGVGKPKWKDNGETALVPIVLDLDGDGLELTASDVSPGFDIFHTGYSNMTGWFTGGDGLLVLDYNLNNTVDDITEISFIHHDLGAATDLEALSALDTNSNGQIDSGDATFSQFRVWRDTNMNGISDSGELQSLTAAGVSAIGLQASGGGYELNGNKVFGVSTFTRLNGGTGNAYDVGFEAFGRPTKFVSENSTWSIVEIQTGERVAVAKEGAPPVTISNLGSFSVNGSVIHGLQLQDGNDTISTSPNSLSRGYYVDGGGGNDVLNLTNVPAGSVIKGGAGDDYITGTSFNDFYYPGTHIYGDTITDVGGNDDYNMGVGTFAWITDSGGTDTLTLSGFVLSDLNFMEMNSEYWGHAVSISSDNGAFGAIFVSMFNSSAHGIDWLVTDDAILSRDEIITMASQWWGF